MSHAVALAWALKVQEAERLLQQKHSELQRSQERHAALTAELKDGRADELQLRLRLLEQQEQLARAKRLALTRQQQAEQLQERLEDDAHPTSMAVASAAVHASMDRARKAMQAERERMAQWQQELEQEGGPLHELRQLRADLHDTKDKLKLVEEVLMPELHQRLDCAPLEQRVAAVQAQMDSATAACAAESERLAQLVAATRAADEQAALAEEQINALQVATFVASLQGQLLDAHREQAMLQGQLEGMEAWLAKLKHESTAPLSPSRTTAGMWHNAV